MTARPGPAEPCPALTSFAGQTGRFHVCPTAQGLHVTVQRYDGPPHSMTLDRDQAEGLLRLLQQSYPGQD